jgi:hypothetical protein
MITCLKLERNVKLAALSYFKVQIMSIKIIVQIGALIDWGYEVA